MTELPSATIAPPIICPICGKSNPHDAIFCANPECGKALGEFRYVKEEVAAESQWHETIAARVAAFVSHPFYILLHVAWFGAWIAVNTGFVMVGRRFDDYPFSLLGILIAIEAIFVTGFLLITQNRQTEHADKRAELDYEVNVRTYRELGEIKRMLHDIERRMDERTSS
jgi:uncharacterized membrane protein